MSHDTRLPPCCVGSSLCRFPGRTIGPLTALCNRSGRQAKVGQYVLAQMHDGKSAREALEREGSRGWNEMVRGESGQQREAVVGELSANPGGEERHEEGRLVGAHRDRVAVVRPGNRASPLRRQDRIASALSGTLRCQTSSEASANRRETNAFSERPPARRGASFSPSASFQPRPGHRRAPPGFPPREVERRSLPRSCGLPWSGHW